MAEEQPAGIGLVYLTLDDVLELYALIYRCSYGGGW
jgi:hypothetical protein